MKCPAGLSRASLAIGAPDFAKAFPGRHPDAPWCHHAAYDEGELGSGLDCRQLRLDGEPDLSTLQVYADFRSWCRGCQDHYRSERWAALPVDPPPDRRSLETARRKIQAAKDLVGETPEVVEVFAALERAYRSSPSHEARS